MAKTRFRVRIDLGDEVVDLTIDGGIGEALRAGYDECKNRRQNPVNVTATQIIEQGKWHATAPIRQG